MFATPPTKDTAPPAPIDPSKEQAIPLGPYYETILNNPQPIPPEKPEEPPTTTSAEPEEAPPKPRRGRKPKEPKNDTNQASTSPTGSSSSSPSASYSSPVMAASPDSTEAKVRVVFGSRLVGPAERAERLVAIRKRSSLVAGVFVPPRPEEPDNCCMSGCVNCVWDRYRDEMEEWAAAHQEAERRLRAREAGVAATSDSMAAPSAGPLGIGHPELDHGAVSLEDDGGSSSRNRDVANIAGQGTGTKLTKDLWDDSLYQNIPVGIREFMKHEKRLKDKHMREGTIGG